MLRGKTVRIRRVKCILLTLGLAANVCAAQEAKPVPELASAAVPFYPRVPQQAHIEGVVRLRISTDGNRVASVEVESGQPMLVQAAQENVKTWQFERHAPASFETTFRYRIFPSKCDSQCNCEGVEKRTVLLRLPTEAEVSAEELMTCDPATEIKPKKQ
jgi:TonB family protein